MPRVNDVYQIPAGTTGSPNTVIKSDRYNSFVNDVADEFNSVRPVAYGGTGESSLADLKDALDALGGDDGPFLLVCAGQSNAWGNELADSGNKTTNSRVFAWNYDTDQWVTATLGSNPFRPRVTQTITNITRPTSTTVTITYTGGDIYFTGTGGDVTISGVVGMTQINGLTLPVTAVDTVANTITCTTSNNAGWGSYTSGGVITGPYQAPNNFAFHLAKRIQEETGRDVYLVLLAVPATAIDRWLTAANGGTGETTNNYEDPAPSAATREKLQLLVEAALASSVMTAAGKTKIDLFAWHQGESDNSRGYDAYLEDARVFVNQVKAEAWWGPASKFVAGEMSYTGDYDDSIAVWRYLYASGTIENFALASSAEIPTTINEYATTGDTTHFSGAGLVTFGYERYWNAYAQIPVPFLAGSSGGTGRGGVINVPSGTTLLAPFDAAVEVNGNAYLNVTNAAISYVEIDPTNATKGTEIESHNFSTSGVTRVSSGGTTLEDPRTGKRSVDRIWQFPGETVILKRYGSAASGPWRAQLGRIDPAREYRHDLYEPFAVSANGDFRAYDTGYTLNTWEIAPGAGFTPGSNAMRNTDTSGLARDLLLTDPLDGVPCVYSDRVRSTARILTTASPTISNFRLLLGFYNSSGVLIGSELSGTSNTADNSAAWATLTVEGSAPLGAAYALARVRVAKTVGTVHVSDWRTVRLRQPSEITKPEDMAAALGTQTSGTLRLLSYNGEWQHYTNGGAHTLVAPNVIHLPYDGQTVNFSVNDVVTGATSGATGVIVSDFDNGADGTLLLAGVTGTFQDNENLQVSAATRAVANIPQGATVVTNFRMSVLVTNNASAGAITRSGFTFEAGDTLTTTNGHRFIFDITHINGVCHLQVRRLQ